MNKCCENERERLLTQMERWINLSMYKLRSSAARRAGRYINDFASWKRAELVRKLAEYETADEPQFDTE